GIVGYGNLGRGVEQSVAQQNDMELVGVFSRRDPKTVETVYETTNVYAMDDILSFQDQVDVLVLCGGSKDDLPVQTPQLAKHFNVVDSFDNHAEIPNHFETVGKEVNETTAIISTGWDPGLFSLQRVMMEAILPVGESYTFWGKGLSQGHSDAVRRVEGVKNGVQYTIPSEPSIERIRNGELVELST